MSRLPAAAGRAAGYATTLAYLSGWRLVRLLPERRAQALFRRIADRVHRRDGAGVRRLRANLHVVCPDLCDEELDRLTRDAVRSYLRYWCESFRLPSWPVEDAVRRVTMVNEHIAHELYGQGRGLVAALPHMANWDWAGVWATRHGMPLVTVAERLEPARLYDEFVAYRTGLGMEILPLTGGDPAFARLRAWVTRGGFACLLADRDLSRTGVEVQLCGRRAKLPRGPAALAQQTGAPLMPVTLSYDGDHLVMHLHQPVPHQAGEAGVVAMTQALADVFTGAIREHPQDWHMMQKVFLG
jgi:phosphatidylinositol dimannoside acyltransferase